MPQETTNNHIWIKLVAENCNSYQGTVSCTLWHLVYFISFFVVYKTMFKNLWGIDFPRTRRNNNYAQKSIKFLGLHEKVLHIHLNFIITWPSIKECCIYRVIMGNIKQQIWNSGDTPYLTLGSKSCCFVIIYRGMTLRTLNFPRTLYWHPSPEHFTWLLLSVQGHQPWTVKLRYIP